MLQAKAASYLNSNETFFGGFQTLWAVVKMEYLLECLPFST